MAAGFVSSPNMFLPIPTVGVEGGPLYAQDVNSSLTIIDGHSHVAGSGVLITPAALNINADFTMQNHRLFDLSTITFIPTATPPPIDSIYVNGLELHYVDGVGNDVQITTGGAVNATSSGITNGFATAAFVGTTLVVDQSPPNPTTPANIQAGHYAMGNATPASFFVTLQPVVALASSYSLTFPILPLVATNNIMTLDTAGNMGTESFNDAAATSNNANFPGNAVQENGRNVVVSNTNETNSLAIIRGVITNALSGGGTGFTWTRSGTNNGLTTITFTTAFSDIPVVVGISATTNCMIAYNGGAGITTSTAALTADINGTLQNIVFNFMAIGQRT